MAYVAPLGERTSELRGSPLRRLVGGLLTVLGMGVCIGTLLVLLADAVTEDTPRRTAAPAPSPRRSPCPTAASSTVPTRATSSSRAASWGSGSSPWGSPTDWSSRSRRRSTARAAPRPPRPAVACATAHGRGAVPGGRREVARTVVVPAAAPAASAGLLGVVEAEDLPARRSAPGPRGPGHDLRPDPGAPPTRARAPPRAPTRAEAPPGPDADAGARTGPSPSPRPRRSPPRSPSAEDPSRNPSRSPRRSRRGARSRPGARRRRRPRTPDPAPPLPRPARRRRRTSVARHPPRHGSLGLASRTAGPGAVAQPAAVAGPRRRALRPRRPTAPARPRSSA